MKIILIEAIILLVIFIIEKKIISKIFDKIYIWCDKVFDSSFFKKFFFYINVINLAYCSLLFSIRDFSNSNNSNYIEDILNILFDKNIAMEYSLVIAEIIMNFRLIVYIYLWSLFIVLVLMLYVWARKQWLKRRNFKSNNSTELDKALYNYLKNENDKSPILIEGEWGVGKTYTLDSFFNEYFDNFRRKKIYKISCFGISTREAMIDVIKDTCENADNSLIKYIVDMLSCIPLFGDLIKKLFDKRYEITNITEGSIFIFDNFERITPLIKKKRIEKDVISIEYTENEVDIIEKYNIVTGIIDELIEKYKMKIIIVANEKEMLNGYVVNNFINKLSCKIFTLDNKNKEQIIDDVWDEIINSIYLSEEAKSILNQVYLVECINIYSIWNNIGDKNIRILRRIFYNYIIFIKKLMNDNNSILLESRILESILYTSIITQINELKDFFNMIMYGECIGEYIDTRVKIEQFEILDFIFQNVNARFLAVHKDKMWLNPINNYELICTLINHYYNNINYKQLTKFNFNSIEINKYDKFYIKEVIYLSNNYEKDFFECYKKIFEYGEIVYSNEENEENQVNELILLMNAYNKNVFDKNYDYKIIMKNYLEQNFSNIALNKLGNKEVFSSILYI